LAVSADAVGRGAAQYPAGPPVDDLQPLLELVIEIARAAEGATRQKGSLQIIMGAFDDALVLRLSG
jgi:hypothetical protein